jgi:hypothetical protein
MKRKLRLIRSFCRICGLLCFLSEMIYGNHGNVVAVAADLQLCNLEDTRSVG